MQVLREATRGRLISLELEWEAVMNGQMWMLGTELKSSGKTASVCFSHLEAKILICIPLIAQLGLVQRMCLRIHILACCDFNNVSKSEKQNGRSLKLPWPLLRWSILLNSLVRTSQTYCSCVCHAYAMYCSCVCCTDVYYSFACHAVCTAVVHAVQMSAPQLSMPCRCCVPQLCMP